MLEGGLPEGASVVLQGPPGQEKLLLALTFLAPPFARLALSLQPADYFALIALAMLLSALPADARGGGKTPGNITWEAAGRNITWE